MHLTFRRAIAPLAVLCCCLFPPPAFASPVTITVGPDPHEDTPIPITVSGTADGTQSLDVVLMSDSGCKGSRRDLLSQDVTGSFSITKSISFEDPSQFYVCAYLDGPWFPEGVGDGWAPLTVRPASGSIAIHAPSMAREGMPFSFSVTGTSELPEQVFVETERFGECWDHYVAGVHDPVLQGAVAGPFTFTGKVTPDFNGRIKLCAYVQEGTSSGRAIASATTSVLVTDACAGADRRVSHALAAYRRAVRASKRAPHSRRLRRLVRTRRAALDTAAETMQRCGPVE